MGEISPAMLEPHSAIDTARPRAVTKRSTTTFCQITAASIVWPMAMMKWQAR